MKHILFLFLLFIVSGKSVYAQQDSTAPRDKARFKLGVYYTSNLHYYGRTDSLQSSGLFPVAELWPTKHFYLTAAPVFTYNRVARYAYAGAVTTAGFRTGKEKVYNSTVYLVVPVYKDNSQLVQSALKAQAVASYTWLNKIINVTAGGDIKWSDQLDYGATAALDHIFRFDTKKQSVWVIDPMVTINAGTQRFTRTYWKRSEFVLFPPQQVTEQVNGFSILSYEFSMPVVFAKGKFQFIANPAYVLPQNLVVVEGRPDLSERGKAMFYATIGAKYNF